jgi:hypothetical protein
MNHALLRCGLGICFLTLASPSFALSDACKQGFVWRNSTPTDHVCVTPDTRAQGAADNAAASAHTLQGSDACLSGYVWREANPQDHVCVTPPRRTQMAKDNAAALRAVSPTVVTSSQAGQLAVQAEGLSPQQGKNLLNGIQKGGAPSLALATTLATMLPPNQGLQRNQVAHQGLQRNQGQQTILSTPTPKRHINPNISTPRIK